MKLLKPNKNKLTGGYSDSHKGYDHSGRGDQNYYSSIYGKVTQAKNSETKNWINKGKLTTADYGNYLIIKSKVDGETISQLGAHFKQGTVLPVGTEVSAGQVVAQIGNTGNSTAAHSHTEYRDKDNHNFPVDFIDKVEEVPPVSDTNKEQIIIDAYKAVTGEYPTDNEKKARLQKNENTVELIVDLLTGDGKAKPRWLEIWGVDEPDTELQATLEKYQETIQEIKELLGIRAGDNSEDVIGKLRGILKRISELEKAQVPAVVYKMDGKDFVAHKIIWNLYLLELTK